MPIKRKIGNLDSVIKNTKNPNNIYRDISDFLNTEVRSFAHYTIETRCCCDIYDGLKVGARKLLHAAFKGGLKDGTEKKVPTLVGDLYIHSLYQHGDASAVGTILTLGAEYLYNLNPLEIIGAHGFLRSPNSAAAPRYLFCKLSKYSKLYKVDEDLIEYVYDEGEYLEPERFFPIIPLILCNRNEGLAPGYRFCCFSYNPLDIIDACAEVIKSDTIKTTIRPYVRGIKTEKFTYDKETNRWWNIGEWTIDEKNDILHITDLPYDVSFEKFEKKLNAYIENQYIKEWKNFSHDNIIDYKILFAKGKLTKESAPDKKEQLLKKFMLQTVIPEDMLYVLDENKKVKHFTNKEELLIHFVKIRLDKYNDRKNKLVTVKEQQLVDNDNLCKFIELVTTGKLIINNRKMPDVKADMAKYNLPEKLLQVQISKLTQEEKEEIIKKSETIKSELEYIKNTTIEQMYLDDLKNLRKELINDFK